MNDISIYLDDRVSQFSLTQSPFSWSSDFPPGLRLVSSLVRLLSCWRKFGIDFASMLGIVPQSRLCLLTPRLGLEMHLQ